MYLFIYLIIVTCSVDSGCSTVSNTADARTTTTFTPTLLVLLILLSAVMLEEVG